MTTSRVKDLSCSRPGFQTEALNWQSKLSKATKARVRNMYNRLGCPMPSKDG